MRRRLIMIGLALLAILIIAFTAYRFLLPRYSNSRSNSLAPIERWFDDPSSRPELATTMNRKACRGAPFILPSDGFIGMLWGDPAAPYTILNTHTGIDIFGDGAP